MAIRLPDRVKRRLSMKPGAMLLRFGWQQLMISLGATLSALAYVVFQLPYNIAAGGVSGLGIIVNHWTGFPLSQSYLFTDLGIILLAAVVFSVETGLMAVLTLILWGFLRISCSRAPARCEPS